MNKFNHEKKFKSNIKELREIAGLTQIQLANLLGITETTISNWETGRSGLKKIHEHIQLCKILNCNLDDLISQEPSSVNTTLQARSNPNNSIQNLRELLGTETTSSLSEIRPAIDEIEIADQE